MSSPIASPIASRGTARSSAPGTQPIAPSAIWRSVGKLPSSLTTVLRAGSRRSAATISLNRLAEVEIGDDHLVRARADQPGDLAADPLRRLDPAFVPAPDQAFAPLPLDHVGERGRRGSRQRAERIAVEIDHALRQGEPVAEPAQRIGGVARPGLFEGHSPNPARISCLAFAQLAVSGATSSTWPVSGMRWSAALSPAFIACAS